MKLYVKQTRNISSVPKSILSALIISFLFQCFWHHSFTNFTAKRYALSEAPKSSLIRLASLDDPVTAAKVIMLWLQTFDNQPGVSIPLLDLNYDRVIEWMNLILELDNKSKYPLLAAIRFYAEVQDEKKQRKMIAYVSDKFIEDPESRWQFMTHAVYIAKHRIKDMQLALESAALIRHYSKDDSVPYWAKQMEIFVLEDMGELESAMVLIGGLLESGELEDPHQRRFLGQRLEEIKQRHETE